MAQVEEILAQMRRIKQVLKAIERLEAQRGTQE
jgi:hypothetical protein